jgi:hypothetical protein
MGKPEQKRPEYLIGFFKLWALRIIIGSSIAFVARKADNYLDKKYGPSDYDKKIVELWDAVKGFF